MRTAALAALLVGAATGRAADAVYTVDAPLATPKKGTDARVKEPLDRVPLTVWVPDGVNPVRGVVFNPFNEKQPAQTAAQETARAWGFAVVGADYFGASAKDYGTSLVAGLIKLAAEQKRPEFAHVPILMVGMSAGAGMCVRFADQLPERTLAVAAVCLEVGPTTDATRRIPVLTIVGEKDGRQLEQVMAKLPEQRKLGARWAVAVQWGRRHEWGQANNLVYPFFDDVIRLRLPAGADPAKGPVRLTELTEFDGFCAAPPGKGATEPSPVFRPFDHRKDATAACWFPSHGLARAWQGFVGRSPAAVRSPAPVGDGKQLTLHEAGRPLVLTLTGVNDVRAFSVYNNGAHATYRRPDDGDTAEIMIPAERLGTGVRPLVVVPDEDHGVLYTPLRPTVVVVK